jgi:hypothetical protein
MTDTDLAGRLFAVWLDPPSDDAAGLAALTIVDGRIAAVCVVCDDLGTLLGLDAVTLRN